MSFTWRDTPPQAILNLASLIFTGQFNEVGRTYPVFNGVRTYTGAPGTEIDPIANALVGPTIEREPRGPRIRITQPGNNTVTALMHVPMNGPWNAQVSVVAIRQFSRGDTQSCEAIRSVESSLPAGGTVMVQVVANPRLVQNTIRHEGLHAVDIREVCESVFTMWYSAISVVSGEWFATDAALDEALFRAAGFTQSTGMRRRRFADEFSTLLASRSTNLHWVRERHNEFIIVNPRWIPATRTLQFAIQELTGAPVAPAGPAAHRIRRPARRMV